MIEQGRNAGMANAAAPLTAVVPGQPVNGDTQIPQAAIDAAVDAFLRPSVSLPHAIRAALEAALPHLPAPVSVPGQRGGT